MKKMICFDMDGTIANLYGVENWLEKIRNENPEPYRVAKPLVNIDELNEILINLAAKGWEIRVISWLAKDSSESYKEEVRKAKMEWLTKNHFFFDVAHLVEYGTTKANCVRKYANPAILIDDDAKVRSGWTLGGTIDPTKENWLEILKSL